MPYQKASKRSVSRSGAVAVIYTRVSSEEQKREGVSLAAQLLNCRRYVAAQGWPIDGEYQDVMRGTRDDRTDYQRMLARVRELRAEGRAVVVVCAWLHRLGRKMLESVRCREEFKELGVPIHSVLEGGEVDDLRANIMASVAQYEVDQLGERVSAALAHIQGMGLVRGCTPAWGYRLRKATPEERTEGAPKVVLEVDEVQAAKVREAFLRAANGESLNAIARWAAALPERERGAWVDVPEDERKPKQRGKMLSYAAIRKTLKCPTYIARQHYDVDENGDRIFHFDEKGRKVFGVGAPAEEVVARPVCRWPALVDDETWAAVQERIARHQRVPRQASGRHLLTGLLFCPECASRRIVARMNGQGATRRNGAVVYAGRYRCKGTQGAQTRGAVCNYEANMNTLDRAVIGEVARVLAELPRLRDRRFVAALEREWQALQAPPPTDAAIARHIRQHEADAAKAVERIKTLTIKLADGAINDATYKATVKDIERARDAALKEAASLRGAPVRPRALPPLETVLARIGGWEEALAKFDVTHQREILVELIERIEPMRAKRLATRGTPFAYEAKIDWTPKGHALRQVVGNQRAAA